jgi:hypothetical protein
LLRELTAHSDPSVRRLAGHLILALRHAPEEVALLEDLADGTVVRPLTEDEEAIVRTVLGPVEAQSSRVLGAGRSGSVPVLALPELPSPLRVEAPPLPPPLDATELLKVVEVTPGDLPGPLPTQPMTVLEVVQTSPRPTPPPLPVGAPEHPSENRNGLPTPVPQVLEVPAPLPLPFDRMPPPVRAPQPSQPSFEPPAAPFTPPGSALPVPAKPQAPPGPTWQVPLWPFLVGGGVLFLIGVLIATILAVTHRSGPRTPPTAQLIDAPVALNVRAGQSTAYRVLLGRTRPQDAHQVRLENLPAQLSCAPVTIAPGQTVAHLVLVADPDARDWSGNAVLTLSVGGQRTDSRSVSVTVFRR